MHAIFLHSSLFHPIFGSIEVVFYSLTIWPRKKDAKTASIHLKINFLLQNQTFERKLRFVYQRLVWNSMFCLTPLKEYFGTFFEMNKESILVISPFVLDWINMKIVDRILFFIALFQPRTPTIHAERCAFQANSGICVPHVCVHVLVEKHFNWIQKVISLDVRTI